MAAIGVRLISKNLHMKNLVLKGIFAACAVSMFLACNSNPDGDVVSQEEMKRIKEEIQAREDEFAAVYNSGELKSIGYYADDATTFYQNRPPLIGKEAIVEFLKSDLDSNTNTIILSLIHI